MKHNIIFILTMATLGSIYPVLSNIRTEASEPTIVAEAAERVEEPAEDAIDFVEPEPEVSTTPVVVEKPVAEPVYVAPATQPDHIEIAGRWINIYNVNSTSLDAGNSVYRFVNLEKGYKGKFLYGHNSANVFGGLKNLGVGSTFTVTLDNQTVTYRVSKTVIFEKDQATGYLTLNGQGKYMNKVAKATYDGVEYDLSLMTCHGQPLGHGDATHRLVIFANRI